MVHGGREGNSLVESVFVVGLERKSTRSYESAVRPVDPQSLFLGSKQIGSRKMLTQEKKAVNQKEV